MNKSARGLVRAYLAALVIVAACIAIGLSAGSASAVGPDDRCKACASAGPDASARPEPTVVGLPLPTGAVVPAPAELPATDVCGPLSVAPGYDSLGGKRAGGSAADR